MIEYYNQRAPEYEAIYHKPERQTELAKLKSHIQGLMKDYKVLELACGTGFWTEVIAKTCQSIEAIDASEEVLRIAASKNYGETPVRFMQGDVYDLNNVTGAYNAGLAAFWWSHIPKSKIAAFLKSFHAKLQPGATVCFIDNNYVSGSSTPIADEDAEGNTYQFRRLNDGTTHRVLKNFPTDAALRSYAGANAEIKHFKYYWCLTYRVGQ